MLSGRSAAKSQPNTAVNPEGTLPVRHYDWIAHFGRRTPDKLAAIDLASGRQLSYAQFDARISRLAAHLRDRLNINRGDRIAVLAMNTTDTLEVQFACGRIGAVFLPLNTRLTVPELQYIVGDAAPSLIIHDAELAEAAVSLARLCNIDPSLLLGPGGREDARRKAGSSGKPVLHTEVRIVKPDGSEAGVGELGELWVRGPNVTPGYWNRPDANQSSFTDGWLHTGDATRIDEEGFYYIVDRWKDMYISGGENVYPAEVENVLHQLAAIAEAAVIGVPHEQWGEVGMAIVAVKSGHAVNEAEIHAHCAANLARFKCPRLIRFVDALPRNATGKIHKPTLRGEFGVPAPIDSAKAKAS